jgi:RNA-directed DNA polymerase
MKRTANLFERIVAWDNLRLATALAMRGKRDRPAVKAFIGNLDRNVAELRDQLLAGTVRVGEFQQFVIHDPKQRVITAPCFRERVLHHAIMNVCEPVFERWLIDDTYACRRGRGQVVAVNRAARFASRHEFFVKLDIRKYFDSVSHSILLDVLAKLFKDARLLDLFARIVTAFRGDLGRGLPIGSLTSQHFANFYLGWFDRQVKERWHIKGYVRYMDDMVIWANDRNQLEDASQDAVSFLGDTLDLVPKDSPRISRSARGLEFLGCRVTPNCVTLNRRSRRRFRSKLRALEHAHLDGGIGGDDLQRRATALLAFTRHDGVSSWQFRQRVLQQCPVSGHKARTV